VKESFTDKKVILGVFMKRYFLALALLFVLVSSLSGVAYADEIDKCFAYLNS